MEEQMQNGLNIVEVLERQERCLRKGQCFISLRPLSLIDKVAVGGPLFHEEVHSAAKYVAIHTDFVTQSVWDSGKVVAGAENVDPSITMNATEGDEWVDRKKGDTKHRIRPSRITGTPSQRD
jgi:hypothetical protein